MREQRAKNAQDIGPAVLEHRLAKQLTQRELAIKIGASVAYVDMVEKNQVVPSLTRFKSIARELSLEIGPFLQWVGDKTSIEGEEPPPPMPETGEPLPEKPATKPTLLSNLSKLFSSQERRRATRFEADFMVLCQIHGEKMFSTTLDVSTTGLRILVSRVIPEHTILQLEIETKSHKICFKARLVWTEAMKLDGLYQAGLDITEISPQDREILRQVAEGSLKVEEI